MNLKQPEIRYSSSTSILGTEKKKNPLVTLDSHDLMKEGKTIVKTPAAEASYLIHPELQRNLVFRGAPLDERKTTQIASKRDCSWFFMNFHGGLMLYLHICIYIYINNVHYFCSYGCFHSCMFCCCCC